MIQAPANSIYSCKPCNNKDDMGRIPGTRGVSSSALVFLLVFYVCVFYAFGVSLTDAVSDGRFLFFLSNTLIVILAADFGTFLSSLSSFEGVDAHEPYDGKVSVSCNELVKLPVATHGESEEMKGSMVAEVGLQIERERVGDASQVPAGVWEVNLDAPQVPAGVGEVKLLTYQGTGCLAGRDVADADNDGERLAEMIEEGAKREEDSDGERLEEMVDEGAKREEDEEKDETSRLLDEEPNKRAKVEEEEDETSRLLDEEPNKWAKVEEEEDDEFSQMSDEELNKRVEEFIWRLKTQIRLQAARDMED